MMPHVSDEVLNGFQDGALDVAARDRVERHLGACTACRARSDGLVAVRRRLDELPRAVVPETPLWPEIRARIERERPAIVLDDTTERDGNTQPAMAIVDGGPDETVAPVRRTRPPRWLLLAAAAVTLMVASSAATLLFLDGGSRQGAPQGTYAALPASADPAVRFAEVEVAYLAAAAELMTVLERERRNLPPDVAERAERSLALIDLAVRETRAALASDPHNRALARMALSAHERKLEFLQRITRWSTES